VLYVAEVCVVYDVMLLSHCFSEQPLVTAEKQQTPYPHLRHYGDSDVFGSQTSYDFYADDYEVCTCADIISAITACFAIYWIFDIQYPRQFRIMLTLLDCYVFNKRSERSTQKVLSFVNKLKNKYICLLDIDYHVHFKACGDS